MRIYTSTEGDRLDKIVWDFYGALTPALLSTVYDANQNLADHDQPFDAGIVVNLPAIELSVTEEVQQIKLTS